MLYSLIVIYVGSNNSEYFGGEFSLSIFLLVSMLGFDSFDAGVDKTYFHCGNKHFQIVAKHMNKAAKTACIENILSTLFISSIEFQGISIMGKTKNNTTELMMKYWNKSWKENILTCIIYLKITKNDKFIDKNIIFGW